MSHVLAIDPGVSTGWARVVDGRLFGAGLGDPRSQRMLPGPGGLKVVIERPMVYPGGKTPNPNDLITLAIQVGQYKEAFESAGYEVEELFPRTWKGTVDGLVCCRRVLASLSSEERAILDPILLGIPSRKPELWEGRRHNVIDAVGIAKWSLKRVRPAVFC